MEDRRGRGHRSIGRGEEQRGRSKEGGDRREERGGSIIVTSVVGNVGIFHCCPEIASINYCTQCGIGF